MKAPFFSAHDSILPLATTAQQFLRSTLEKNPELLISSHLAAEIQYVLTSSGNQIPYDQANRLIQDLIARRGTLYRPVSQAVLTRAAYLSGTSGIPIWDYLVALPFEDAIDKIYTIDPHFQHSSLSGLAQIENPLGIWKEEGQAW